MSRMKRRLARKARSSTPKPAPRGRMRRKTKTKAVVEKTPVTGKNTLKKPSTSGKTASYTNTNRRAQATSEETGSVKTKAGNYPVYKKKSAAATSFRTAFANARKSGYKTFTWEGKKYNTKTK